MRGLIREWEGVLTFGLPGRVETGLTDRMEGGGGGGGEKGLG